MKIEYDYDNLPDMSALIAKNYNDTEFTEWTPDMKYKDPVSGVKRIGVLTSGGDSPGMNAAIRSITRAAIYANIKVYGIKRGYHGLMKGEMYELSGHDVSETVERGGTFLMTARSKSFCEPEGTLKAAKVLEANNIDVLVVIGGDGSFKGARQLARLGVPVIGIPATIDNDVSSTDYTIGYDTAMNTAVQAIDKLRDTSSSHERCSVVEVMGRSAGWIAHNVGIATGAEVIMVPEIETDFENDVKRVVLEGKTYQKKHWLIVVAEGAGNASDIAARIEAETGVESRATVLGYIQRGGSPTLTDRTLASLMGLRACDCIISGRFNRVIAAREGKIVDMDIEEALALTKPFTRNSKVIADRLF